MKPFSIIDQSFVIEHLSCFASFLLPDDSITIKSCLKCVKMYFSLTIVLFSLYGYALCFFALKSIQKVIVPINLLSICSLQ